MIHKRFSIAFTVCLMIAMLIFSTVMPAAARDGGNSEIKPSAQIGWEDAPSLSGTSAIMIDGGSGDILYAKNINEQREPASISKVVTCMVVLDTADLDQKVTIPYDSNVLDRNLNLKKGEVFTIEELLYAMMLYSANDVAEALAVIVGGSVDKFSDMMNEKVEQYGAKDTHFDNPSGLNGAGYGRNLTTAYDLSVIAREAMKNPTFREIVRTPKYTIPATNMSKERSFRNSNACLYLKKKTVEIDGVERPFKYEGTTGIKTGYTSAAGDCFCGSAKKGNTELITVILNAASTEDKFADTIKLWDYGFSKYKTYTAARGMSKIDEAAVRRGAMNKVDVATRDNMDITLNRGYDEHNITTELVLYEENEESPGEKTVVDKITAPIKKGQLMGELVAYNEKREPVAKQAVYAVSDVAKGGPLSYIGISDNEIPLFILAVIGVLVLLILLRILAVRRRRKKKDRRKAQRKRNVRRKEWDKEKNPFE